MGVQDGYAGSTCRLKDPSAGATRCSLNSIGTAESLPTDSFISAYTMDSPSDAGPDSRRASHQTLAPASLQQYYSYLCCTPRIIRVLHTVYRNDSVLQMEVEPVATGKRRFMPCAMINMKKLDRRRARAPRRQKRTAVRSTVGPTVMTPLCILLSTVPPEVTSAAGSLHGRPL